ncbi:hypothetical protein [Nonomuraea sp. NPDC050786]|uniref:hypothetical protein n=1 Tax=Nonomuraea sp. NPDC050786 TaxID=3154840 RepID=UPI0033DD188A
MLLRNPAGQPAAQYAPNSEEAKQSSVQGLSVINAQACQWKLEITNAGAEPVTAELAPGIAGNPVTVVAKAEQPSEHGRIEVTGTVTDGGQPIGGVPVRHHISG